MWKIFVGVSIVVVIGLCIYNIRSLIRKWKANPKSWFDLLVGMIIWGAAIAVLIYIFFNPLLS